MGLGTWRFFLAFLVAISHLYAGMIRGPSGYAVWCFFVLSGFLMVLVLSTKYGTSSDGVRAYAFNRFMRIYPGYIAAVGLGLVTIWIFTRLGVDLRRLAYGFGYPESLASWVATLGMIHFLPHDESPISQVSWALLVEVSAYALMPLFAKSRHATILGLALALAANLEAGFAVETRELRYKGFSTAMVAFAAGALLCHYREQLRCLEAPRASVYAWIAHGLCWVFFPEWHLTYGLLLSVPLSAWVVLSLARVEGGRVDRWLGGLSYPVYLVHFIAGAWMCLYFGFERGFSFFAASFALTLVVSWLFVTLIDRRADRLKMAAPSLGVGASRKAVSRVLWNTKWAGNPRES